MTRRARFRPVRRSRYVRRRMEIRDLSPHLLRDIGLDPWPRQPPVGPIPRW